MLTLHQRLSPVLYTQWVLKTHQLSAHWRPGHTSIIFSTWQHICLSWITLPSWRRGSATYSKNKCKYSSDNPLISNTFSLPMQDSSPLIWLSPTTPPIFFLGRVSVLSFTLKAIHLPQDKGFPLSRWKQMLCLREKAINPRHNDTSQALTTVCITGFLFFSWQRSHNSGVYAKIIKWRLLLKGPIHHSSPHPHFVLFGKDFPAS